MSSFSRKGKRLSESNDRLIYKIRLKEYKKLLTKLQTIATTLNENTEVVYTEENINTYVNPILGRDLDMMEVFFIMSHLNNIKIEKENE